MRTNYKRVQNIVSKAYGEVEFEKSPTRGLVVVFERNVTHLRIVLVEGYYGSQESGIHLRQLTRDNLEHYLLDAVETALKDNFSTIYVHQETKDTPERREASIKSVQSWFDKPWFGANLSEVECDVDEVLGTMTAQQLDLLRKCISAAFQHGGDSSRQYWAPKFHNLRKALIERGVESTAVHDIADARAVSNE